MPDGDRNPFAPESSLGEFRCLDGEGAVCGECEDCTPTAKSSLFQARIEALEEAASTLTYEPKYEQLEAAVAAMLASASDLRAAYDLLSRLRQWDVLNLAPGSVDDGPYWQREIAGVIGDR